MTTPHFSRVLHVGFNPIGSPSNTGVTLQSMFGDWPDENLIELYTKSRQQLGPRNRTVLMVPAAVAPMDTVVRLIVGNRIEPRADGLNNSVSLRGRRPSGRARLHETASAVNDIAPVMVNGSWIEAIRDLRPDVIHSLLGTVRITAVVAGLAERLRIPVVPHFMDDWLDNLFADGQLLGVARRRVETGVRRVMRHAPLALTVGEDMRREYTHRLGLRCVTVGNSVDFSTFGASPIAGSRPAPASPDRPLRFCYVGGLHLGRDRVLARIARAMLRADRAVRLVVHAPAGDHVRLRGLKTENSQIIEVGETLSPTDVAPVLNAADGLVFVESSDPDILRFTRLSVSTKVPEYLAARRPILAAGPSSQASIRALRSVPLTVWCEDQDDQAIQRAVNTLPQVPPSTAPVGTELTNLFGTAATRERLRRALNEAARG